MKILMINVVCGVKSTGRICTDIADILIQQGHEVRIAYGREKTPKKYEKISWHIENNIGIYKSIIRSRFADSCGFDNTKATLYLIKKIKEFKPDIIHLHNLHGYYLNTEILFEYLCNSKIKVVWTLHDCWAFTGHCSHFTIAKCEQWKTKCKNCKQLMKYPKCITDGNVEKNFQKKKLLYTSIDRMYIITPSVWLAERVKESFLNKYSVSVIPNGIDLKEFRHLESDFRKKNNIEDKIVILGVATSWGKEKGLDKFLLLSSKLSDKYKVILVGLSKKQKKRLPKNILGICKTDNIEELAKIYSSADVFLNLGQEETMGLTTVEAMACGTPVVVSNMTAVPEVVDVNGGVILKSLEIDEIIKKINYILKHDYLYTRKNAEIYEKKNQYMKYIKLYNEILENSNRLL